MGQVLVRMPWCQPWSPKGPTTSMSKTKLIIDGSAGDPSINSLQVPPDTILPDIFVTMLAMSMYGYGWKADYEDSFCQHDCTFGLFHCLEGFCAHVHEFCAHVHEFCAHVHEFYVPPGFFAGCHALSEIIPQIGNSRFEVSMLVVQYSTLLYSKYSRLRKLLAIVQ